MLKLKHFLLFIALSVSLMASATVHPVKVNKMEADFKLTRESELSLQPEVAFGHLRYSAYANICQWTYEDGTQWEMSTEMISLIRRVMQGNYVNNNADFQVREDGATLILTPKKKKLKQLYKEIQIRFNPFTGYWQELILFEQTGTEPTDPRGDIITLIFRNVEAE